MAEPRSSLQAIGFAIGAPPGFGVVRLKLLLAISRAPELDRPGWSGTFQATIGATGQVKARAHEALGEVQLDDGNRAEPNGIP